MNPPPLLLALLFEMIVSSTVNLEVCFTYTPPPFSPWLESMVLSWMDIVPPAKYTPPPPSEPMAMFPCKIVLSRVQFDLSPQKTPPP